MFGTTQDNTAQGLPGGGRRAGGLPRLLLASQSPRRRLLLREHGVEHDAEHPGVDDGELSPGRVTPEQWVAALAYFKAAAGARKQAPPGPGAGGHHRLVLGADTVCVKNGELLGQPRDAQDARRMLKLLENGSHEVLTGVAIIDPRAEASGGGGGGVGWRHLFVDRARVRVGSIGDDKIQAYVASGEWRGKAGAYNLGERIAAGWPITYEGDPTTVMGLPMEALLRRLEKLAHREQVAAASIVQGAPA
jgi:septum formation protein